MRRTPVADPKRSIARRERRIEDLLFAYPSLLELGPGNVRRQVVLDPASRLDLLYEDESEIVVVEIKHGRCGVAEVRQLKRYLAAMAGTEKPRRGILVGSALTVMAARACADSKVKLAFKQIGRDVPSRVVVCRECRRVRAAHQARCPQDGSREVTGSS